MVQALIFSALITNNLNCICNWVSFMTVKNDHINVLVSHVKNVLWESFKNIRVVSYILISVVLVGGAGVWMPWLKESSVQSWLPGATVFTYCFALLGSIICNRLYFYTKSLRELRKLYKGLDDGKKIEAHFEDHENGSILSAWGMIFGGVIILFISFAYAKYSSEDSLVGWLGLFLSILLYFSASAEELDNSSRVLSKRKDNEEAEQIVPTEPSEIANNGSRLNSKFFSDGE